MAIEQDTLAVLLRIEKQLKASSNSSGSLFSRMARSASSANPASAANKEKQNQKTYTATVTSVGKLGDAADEVSRRFGRLSRTVQMTQTSFVNLNKAMRGTNRANVTPNNQAAGPGPGAGGAAAGTAVQRLFGPQSVVGQTVSSFSGSISLARIGVAAFAANIIDVGRNLVDDFFDLASRGIRSSSSLYFNAMRAGVSLQEYTQILEQSTPTVMRARSLNDFYDTLASVNPQLNRLGVIGADATKLSAALASSATSIGVPQAQLGNAMSMQIRVFEELRKSTFMTSEQFAQLAATVANAQETQSELLGLSGQERAARLADLQRTQAIGLSIGATAEASTALGNALREQRRMTAQDRFRAAGTIRQAAAISGVDAGSAERLATLSRRKNRTAAENEEFTRLGGILQASLERMQNSGNIQQEFAAEQLLDRMPAELRSQLQAAGNVRLTAESGPMLQKEANAVLSRSEQILGKILGWLEGFDKSPVAQGLLKLVTAVGGIAALGLALRGGLGRAGPGILSSFGMAGQRAAGPTLMQRVASLPGRASGAVRGIGSAIGNAGRGLATGFMEGTLGAQLGTGILNTLKGAFKFIKWPAIFSGLFGFVGELFTGEMTAALSTGDRWMKGEGLKGLIGEIGPRLIDAIFAGLRGIFTSFTGLGDFLVDAWNWSIGSFSDTLKINMESTFTNMFDRIWTSLSILFKEFQIGVLKLFPGSGEYTKGLEADIAVAKETQNKLREDGKATLGSIGEANKKATEEQKRLAEESRKNINIAKDSIGTAAGVVTDLNNLSSTAVNTARTLASPAVQNRAGVTQPVVNTPNANATPAPGTPPPAATTPPTGTTTPELTAQMTQVIDILNRILIAEELQSGFSQRMAQYFGRSPDPGQEWMINRMVRSPYA